ncbi:MAG: ADP-ribosylglycohydrolase family protein [Candidatus Zipacnadales bacterium]
MHRIWALFVAFGLTASAWTIDLPLATYQAKCRGAWAGQMIGVSYGAPYEFKYVGRIMEDPLREWKPEFIRNAIRQDDCYVEMTFLQALEEYGLDITDEEAGKAFAQSQYPLWHANNAGRENCRRGLLPPLSGHPDHNPHADDIDFQIEADLFGIITPGMYRAMRQLCDRFGHIMNYGDGVYGGMFVAGMYSASFFTNDVHEIVKTGLACIPPQSKYAQLIRDVVACHDKDPDDWRACWQVLENKWAPYDLCGRNNPFNIDAKLNGGYIAIGLLYGDGNFEKTLEITTRCGQDNDCNPSNAAGVLGCLLGYDGIPKQFTEGLPTIANENFSFTNYNFGTLTEACTRLARQIVKANGGRIIREGEIEVWQIKLQKPSPSEKLEQWIVLDNDLRLRVEPGRAGRTGVRLRWSPVPGATGYRVTRSRGAAEASRLLFHTENATTFEDTKAPAGEPLVYQLQVRLPELGWQSAGPVRSFLFLPTPVNSRGSTNLAREAFALADAAVLAPTGSGLRDIEVIRDGIVAEQNYDSFDGPNEAAEDWYAIRFARAVHVNTVEYVEGQSFHDGGWWLSLTAQYLDANSFEWRPCTNVRLSPEYDFTDHQEGRKAYQRWTLTFDEVVCAGIRIYGRPGGDADFTSIAELEVYYR